MEPRFGSTALEMRIGVQKVRPKNWIPTLAAYVAAAAVRQPITLTRDMFDGRNAPPMRRRRPSIARIDDVDLSLSPDAARGALCAPRDARHRPPYLVYLHGGGWVFGSLDTHDIDLPSSGVAAPAVPSVARTTGWRPSILFPAGFDDVIETSDGSALMARRSGSNPTEWR